MTLQRGGLQYWRGIPIASHTGAASGWLRGETYETVANRPVEPGSSVGRAGVAGVRSGGRRPSRLDVGSIRSERRTCARRLDMGRSRRVAGERLVAHLLPEAARHQARAGAKTPGACAPGVARPRPAVPSGSVSSSKTAVYGRRRARSRRVRL